jgi:hypothetical protein
MPESLYGELVVVLFVALGDTRGKQVTLARLACVREDADAKFAEFKDLNSRLPSGLMTARWTTTVYL